jgi:DNA-binding CsgD family transcriptional regulator
VQSELDARTYVRDLERRLQVALFSDSASDPEGAVLLVRGAMARDDRIRAAGLAAETQRLATNSPGNTDAAAAAVHARGLVERNPLMLDQAAASYSADFGHARALEDAGIAWADLGDRCAAETRFREAHSLYERLGAADGTARVRWALRAIGVHLCHWTRRNRPSAGWDSLTDTERRIAELVSRGLSNREVAGEVFLSVHTVAFHLRHVFWKLGVSSRVQLTRMVAEGSPPDGESSWRETLV